MQRHSGWFTIFEWWFGRRVVSINFYPQHVLHFLYGTNGAVKGKDNCLDAHLHILGFFFGYTDYGYGRYKEKDDD